MTADVIRIDQLPLELPNDCRMSMTLHMNFGRGGGYGGYTISLPDGRTLPIGHCYNSKRTDGVMKTERAWWFADQPEVTFEKWEDIRAAWPAYLERAKAQPPQPSAIVATPPTEPPPQAA